MYYYFMFKKSFTFLRTFFLWSISFRKGIFYILTRYIEDITLLLTPEMLLLVDQHIQPHVIIITPKVNSKSVTFFLVVLCFLKRALKRLARRFIFSQMRKTISCFLVWFRPAHKVPKDDQNRYIIFLDIVNYWRKCG